MDLTKGEESLFYIKKNNVWFPVGCLTGSPLSEDVEMIETTTRDNGGWKTYYPTLQGYSIELSGYMVKDDSDSGNEVLSYHELRRMKRNLQLINWQRKTLNGYYIDEGQAYITNISDADEVGDMISFNASLLGYGKPIEDNERIYILGNGERTQIYTHPDKITVIQTEE